MRPIIVAALCALSAIGATPVHAQEAAMPLEIGARAPDFELEGATRAGVMDGPVRLTDFRGKTVVLAFFYRARSPG